MAERPACGRLQEGAVRPCGRASVYHLLRKVSGQKLAGWLCASCGNWAIGRGRFVELHTIGDDCTADACSIASAVR